MTGLDLDLRFERGRDPGDPVFKYGLRLLPALYKVYNPTPYETAGEMAVESAIGLPETCYGGGQA